eukprot:GFUD01063587.1.p1 GENE.GFUD01063587.1~~GFUD01063587.1.p1  ORF type:complete len:107 (-),score=12.29 GFUD01063587.1:12-332(-)
MLFYQHNGDLKRNTSKLKLGAFGRTEIQIFSTKVTRRIVMKVMKVKNNSVLYTADSQYSKYYSASVQVQVHSKSKSKKGLKANTKFGYFGSASVQVQSLSPSLSTD